MSTLRVSRTRRARRVAASFALLAAPLLLAQTAWAQTGPIADKVKREFPRLGGIQIGGNPYPGSYNDPDYLEDIARFDVAILNRRVTDANARLIKQRNPDILLGQYTNITEVNYRFCCENETWRNKLNAGRGPNANTAPDWWLYDANGEKIEDWPGAWKVNISDYVRSDSNGDNWVSYRVKFDYDRWFQDPVWDIWYSDVVRAEPPYRSGQYGRFSGGSGSWSDEQAAYRRGHRQHWDGIYAIRPGTMVMANFNWYLYPQMRERGDLDIYEQQVHGGLFEGAMSSTKNRGTWKSIYNQYRRALSFLAKPEVLVFHVQGSPQDWQFFRYTFATALMADGFYKFSPPRLGFGTVEWFDEFDRAGRDNTSWLGLAVTPPPGGAWRNGVYRRDFENGIALVNPKGNGARTVTVESGFRRIMGNQAPGVNNGQPAGEIRLQDGDGIILVRETRESVPADPEPPALRLGN